LDTYLATIFDSEIEVAGAVRSTLLESHGRVIVVGSAGQSPHVRSFGVASLKSVGANGVLDSESRRD
jgi:hypothetical protein